MFACLMLPDVGEAGKKFGERSVSKRLTLVQVFVGSRINSVRSKGAEQKQGISAYAVLKQNMMLRKAQES